MILVDKGITDLISGYDRILQAETTLRHKWRQPLLEAYSRRRQVYEVELSQYRTRSAEFAARFRAGIWLSSVLLILGAVALPALILLGELGSLRGPLLCFAPLLILAGLTGWAILAMLWMWQKERKQPPPPPNPLENRLTDELLSTWRQELWGDFQTNQQERDEIGAYHFIARLQPLDARSFLVYQLCIDDNERVDILYVGPKGVWAFDVFHINGVIRWNDGVWTRSRGVHLLQRAEQVELARDDQAFEAIWRQKVKLITKILEGGIPEVVNENPKNSRVRGGLVFTHPQARFVIPPGVGFNWGVTKFWIEKLRNLPEIPEMDERTSLQLLEVLLTRHQVLCSPILPKSMNKFAEGLVHRSEEQLMSWIAEI